MILNEKSISHLYELMDIGEFAAARDFVINCLEQVSNDKQGNNLLKKVELYGFLIDIGCESSNQEDIENAISFLVNNEDDIKNFITSSSYYYNLANAKQGVSNIFYSKNPGVHSLSVCREKHQEAIDFYWLAYTSINQTDSFRHQILINLSNSLMTNYRIIEALQMLDTVLLENPNFPQALISRAQHLNFLQFANTPVTIALYTQIYLSYQKGIATGMLPPIVLKRSLEEQKETIRTIQSHNFSINNLETEIEEAQKGYEQHSEYRKFCINHFLTLNEHSIYCNCIATSKDELQIGIPDAVFQSEKLPKLELLLNRIKSEFAFARWNYYNSFSENSFENDMIFTELFDNEVINPQSETLRASFRICYGILDKIALGICKMYEIGGGNIYFERFWDDKNRKNILERQRNIHLNALYSIANDLNTNRGQLKHFKNWRNKIEHNLLILQHNPKKNFDFFNILEDKEFIVTVDIDEFKEKTLHLLQLTRAAIFSFVYCIRLETITGNDPNSISAITISPKE